MNYKFKKKVKRIYSSTSERGNFYPSVRSGPDPQEPVVYDLTAVCIYRLSQNHTGSTDKGEHKVDGTVWWSGDG